MRRRWQRTLAVVSVLGILAGARVQAPRGCTVCPVGCPMHVARAGQPGCHQGGATPAQAHPEVPPARCAVRGTCGHVQHGVTAPPAVLPVIEAIVTALRATAIAPRSPAMVGTEPPEPPTHPPKLLVA